MSQAQFLEITETQPRMSTFLDRLLLPCRDDRVTSTVYRPLPPPDAFQAISSNLLKPGSFVLASEVFCPTFDEFGYQRNLQLRLEQLVDEIPVYELKQNARTIMQERSSSPFRDAA